MDDAEVSQIRGIHMLLGSLSRVAGCLLGDLLPAAGFSVALTYAIH